MTARINWSSCPIAFARRPPCPCCGSDATPITIKSLPRESDGSRARHVVCKSCSKPFVLVVEIGDSPEFGDRD